MDKKRRPSFQKVYEWARDSQRPGGEFDWFAIDRNGCVAAFCTAGYGAVPDAVFDSPWNDYLDFIRFLEEMGLPVGHRGFDLYRERRLFVYDAGEWQDGVYSRVAFNERPFMLSEVPLSLRNTAERVVFPGEFGQSPVICPEDHWGCR